VTATPDTAKVFGRQQGKEDLDTIKFRRVCPTTSLTVPEAIRCPHQMTIVADPSISEDGCTG
jgi:hypothetical protein